MGRGVKKNVNSAIAEPPVVRRKLSVDIDPELLKALKISAIEEGMTVRDWVNVILRAQLKNRAPATR